MAFGYCRLSGLDHTGVRIRAFTFSARAVERLKRPRVRALPMLKG